MASRTGKPVRVWRTPQGQAYHRKATCEALADGQREAIARGYEAHEAECVSLSVAMSAGLGECFHCFPENVPHDAKPCQALVNGSWVDGFLLEWRRGDDGRWTGIVNVRHHAERMTVTKDQAHLRPA